MYNFPVNIFWIPAFAGMTVNNMKTNIVLIGYMGTGKTLIGQILAEKLGLNLIETDWLIEQQACMSIPELFDREGEIGFREREISAVREIAGENHAVIACGGGLVLNRINIDRLQQNAVIVYLLAAPEIILKRVSGEAGQRPLLEVADRLKTIEEMLEFRAPFYERAADITIDTSRSSPDEVADKILSSLEEYEGFDSKK